MSNADVVVIYPREWASWAAQQIARGTGDFQTRIILALARRAVALEEEIRAMHWQSSGTVELIDGEQVSPAFKDEAELIRQRVTQEVQPLAGVEVADGQANPDTAERSAP